MKGKNKYNVFAPQLNSQTTFPSSHLNYCEYFPNTYTDCLISMRGDLDRLNSVPSFTYLPFSTSHIFRIHLGNSLDIF